MIALGAALLLAALPGPGDRAASPIALTISTARGEAKLPVRVGADGAPLVPAEPLFAALGGSMRRSGSWADVTVSRQSFRLLLDAPLYVYDGRTEPLAAAARLSHDSVFVPLAFVAEVLPRRFVERYRYDDVGARLVELGATAVATAVTTAAAAPARAPARALARRLANGLRRGHLVTIDAGHGGVDPGNPGMYFPRGVREKDVTLQVALLLREELRSRGVGTRMTRTTDTLIALGDRGHYCAQSCDLFVSLHVNSLPRRAGYTAARGFETYFLAEAKTEEAARVARMENEAVRFESGTASAPVAGLDFILKDLQLNEHLRESAQLAGLLQARLDEVHSGTNRGVKQAGFMVLTTAQRPAVLVEMGYSTNPEDGRMLTTPGSQRRLATAIADAIVAYLLDYERRTGFTADSGGGQ